MERARGRARECSNPLICARSARTCRDERDLRNQVDTQVVSIESPYRAARSREIIRSTISETIRGSARERDARCTASSAKLSPTCCPPRGNFPTRAGKLPVCPPIHTFSGTIPLSRPWRSAWNNFLNLLPSSIRTCVSAAAEVSHRLVKRLVRPSRTLLALAVLPFPCVLRCRRCYRLADSPVSTRSFLARNARPSDPLNSLTPNPETFASRYMRISIESRDPKIASFLRSGRSPFLILLFRDLPLGDLPYSAIFPEDRATPKVVSPTRKIRSAARGGVDGPSESTELNSDESEHGEAPRGKRHENEEKLRERIRPTSRIK